MSGTAGPGRWILATVLLLPVAELVVAVQLGQRIGVWLTLGLIALGMAVGVVVLRREGSQAVGDLRVAQQRLSSGMAGFGDTVDAAGTPLTSGRRGSDRLLVVLAGVLLVVPGLITDVLGLALLLPPVRALVRRRFASIARRRGWTARSAQVQVVRVEDLDAGGASAGGGSSGRLSAGPTHPPVPPGEPRVLEGRVLDDDEGPAPQ